MVTFLKKFVLGVQMPCALGFFPGFRLFSREPLFDARYLAKRPTRRFEAFKKRLHTIRLPKRTVDFGSMFPDLAELLRDFLSYSSKQGTALPTLRQTSKDVNIIQWAY